MLTAFNYNMDSSIDFSNVIPYKVGDTIITKYGAMTISSLPEKGCKISECNIILEDESSEIAYPIYKI